MRLALAHLIFDLVRLLMQLYDWLQEKRAPNNIPVESLQQFEVFSVHCADCNAPTGAFVSGNGALLPPTFCSNCVDLEPGEPGYEPVPDVILTYDPNTWEEEE